VCVLNFNS